MTKIGLSYLVVLPSLFWSWVIMFIPSFVLILKVFSHSYKYDKTHLVIEIGILNKRQLSIPFYRIIDIQASQNILNYGTITIRDKVNTIELKYVNSPIRVANKLRQIWGQAQSDNKVTHTEFF